MKKILLSALYALICFSAFSQDLEFGIKAGFSKDKLMLSHDNSFSSSVEGITTYNYGVYGKLQVWVIGLYVQPELLMNRRASNITITDNSKDYIFEQSASYVDFPVLVGFKFVKTLRIYGGPNFQMMYKQSTGFPTDNPSFSADNLDKKTTGIIVGAGLDLIKFRVDARYDFNAASMGSAFRYNNHPVDVRNGMFTVQLGFKLFGIL